MCLAEAGVEVIQKRGGGHGMGGGCPFKEVFIFSFTPRFILHYFLCERMKDRLQKSSMRSKHTTSI